MNTTHSRCLLRLALPVALFTCSAMAQTPPPVVPYPEPDLRVIIPASLGGNAALRLVDCDLDGDMLRDACILWDNGDVTYACAPEVLSAFTPFPTVGARDIARVPTAFAAPAHPDRDGILLLDNDGLGYFTLAASPSVPSASGLTRIPVAASSEWHALERLEVLPCGEQCWVLGLAPLNLIGNPTGNQIVRIGQWNGTAVIDLGTVTASAPVQQMRLVATTPVGQPHIAVRTNAGVQMWTLSGQPLATLPSPTASTFGALTPYQVAGQGRLAWLALSGQTWRLRTLIGAVMATDVQLTFDPAIESLPHRFRPTGMDVLPAVFGGQHGLLLYQNTRPWHVALQPDAATGFAPICGIEVPQLTMNIDNCPSVLLDLDRDGHGDVATVLTSLHCLQYAMRVSWIAQNGGEPPATLPPAPDYLDGVCQAQAMNGNVPDTLDLPFLVPPEFLNHTDRWVQVVAWPQDLADPIPAPNSNPNEPASYGPAELGAPLQQYLYELPDNPSPSWTLRFPLPLEPTPQGSQWEPHHQAFLMLRLVGIDTMGDDGPHVVWSSPPQLVGFVGDNSTNWPQSLGFMKALSEEQDPAQTIVMHSDPGVGPNPNSRHVGVLLKPLRIRLPSSTVTTPSPAGAVTTQPLPPQ